jgi:uncharacterized protein YqgV (UPF0045/DUF77 family)
MPLTERDIVVIEGRISNAEDRINKMSEAIVEHRTRLQNGVKVFGDQKDRLDTIEKKIQPSPPSVYKIIGITFAVMMAAAGALWALANTIRDRPTIEQIDKVIHAHDKGGHSEMREKISSVKEEQTKQRVIIESVQTEQQAQSTKLDTLIQRTPEPRHRNR